MRGSSEMRALFTFEQIFSDSCEWWLLFTLCHCFTMWTPHTTWFTYHWFTYHTGSHPTLVHIPHWFTYHMVHPPREYDSQPWAVGWNPPTALNNQSKFCTLDIFSLKIETKTNRLHAAGRKSKFPEFKGFSTLSMKGVMVVDAFSVQSFDRWECADDKSVRSNKSGGSPRWYTF